MRFPHLVTYGLLTVLSLVACAPISGSSSPRSSTPQAELTIESAPVEFELTDTDTPQGLSPYTDSQWESLRFHASYPHAPNHSSFNAAIDVAVSDRKTKFQQDYANTPQAQVL